MNRLIVIISIGVLLTACSPQERQEWSNGPAPTCHTTSRGRLLLMAQSVPEAGLIPCIGELPPGWDFERAYSRTDQSVLSFENDTFDLSVDVELEASCDLSTFDEIESNRPATRLFVADSGDVLVYTFDGGCITFAYETTDLANSAAGRAMLQAVPFMTRTMLSNLSGWTL